MSVPKVTVFMPAYNRADIISAAIESVLDQTFTDFELLIVDDGSSDGTVGVIESYADPRIRLERHAVNWGQTPSRNHGLDLARGHYIAMLDSDDVAMPERLARQVAVLDARPEVGEVGGWIRHLAMDGRKGRVKRTPTSARAIRAQMPWRSGIAHTTVMIRADLARRLRYDETLEQAQDYDLHTRLLETHEIANVGAVMSLKRTHPGQVSKKADVSHRFKKATIARLIERLGIDAADADLDRHFAMTRTAATGVMVDDAYLRWAAAWLARLTAANATQGAFPEPEFSSYARVVWRRLCAAGLRGAPGRATVGLLRPPL